MSTDAPRAGGFTWVDVVLVSIVLVAGTVLPRLLVVGGLPSTDEGYYAYQAFMIHQSLVGGRGLPDSGALALYPLLCSWIFGLELNPTVALRCFDLFASGITAILLYGVLKRESDSRVGAALIGLLFTVTMNLPLFIQYGFKNSIMAAFAPLLLAVLIGQRASAASGWAWAASGALTALAVLLRETFVPFAILGVVTVLISRGWRAAFSYACGGVLAGGSILAVILIARGGGWELVQSYAEASTLYASVADQRRDLFISNGLASLTAAAVATIAGAGALLLVGGMAIWRKDRAVALRAVFWVLVSSLPLIEPATKIGMPYHFAVSLPGLAGLCALAWRQIASLGSRRLILSLVVVASAADAVVLATRYPQMLGGWAESRRMLLALSHREWPDDLVGRSNYLLAAAAIGKAMPPSGTVSVSGFMHALYPLTGHLPPSPRLANLSATFLNLGMSETKLRDALLACPADVIMTTTRPEWPGAPEITAAVLATGIYQKVAEIPVNRQRDYGTFGGDIYRRMDLPGSFKEPPESGATGQDTTDPCKK